MRRNRTRTRGRSGRTMDGETLFDTKDLGFNFYHIIGSDPYDRIFDKGLLQMKKGGIMTAEIPNAAQDKFTRNSTNGKAAVLKLELVDIQEAKPDGAKLLENKVEKYGLTAAKEKYKKLMGDNAKGYVFREGAMNTLDYKLMQKGKAEAAVYVFKLNQKNYPKSWNASKSTAASLRLGIFFEIT